MKLFLFLSLPFYLLGLVYLSLPQPAVPIIPGATRSSEPGDTWQNPDQSAYFTNYNRQEVLSLLKDSFSLKLGSYSLPSYRLNYRPEDSTTYVRSHIDTYYLEEIVHPLRESLFVNGWSPQLSPRNAHLPQEELDKQIIVYEGQKYFAKIILKPYFSSLFPRLIVWTLIIPVIYFVFHQFFLSLQLLFVSLKTNFNH